MTRYIYTVRTHDGQRCQVEADNPKEAIELSHFDPATIAPWYPFCTGVVPSQEEEDKKAERFKQLREMAEERKTLRNKGGLKPMTINKSTGELEADFIRRQLTITETPPRTIPAAGLKPKREQNDAPLALEMPEIEKAQGRLF